LRFFNALKIISLYTPNLVAFGAMAVAEFLRINGQMAVTAPDPPALSGEQHEILMGAEGHAITCLVIMNSINV